MDKWVRITARNQTFELEPGLTLLEALDKLGIQPESVLAIRLGEMIAGDCVLEEGDEVRLVGVISGGGALVDRLHAAYLQVQKKFNYAISR